MLCLLKYKNTLFLPDEFLHYCLIIRHAPNDRMLIYKLQFLLLTAAFLDQSFYCLKPKRLMCKSDLAGSVYAAAVILINKIQKPYKNTYTLNSPCFKHRLGPLVCMCSDQRGSLKQPDSAFFNLGPLL
jgi:hypothetical protein